MLFIKAAVSQWFVVLIYILDSSKVSVTKYFSKWQSEYGRYHCELVTHLIPVVFPLFVRISHGESVENSSLYCLTLSTSAQMFGPRVLFTMIQSTNGSPRVQITTKAVMIPWFGFSFHLTLYVCRMCAGVHSSRLLNVVIMTSVCVWANTQLSPWRMHIVCGKRCRAILTSLGQVASSFPPLAHVILHLQLPPSDRSVWSRSSVGTIPPQCQTAFI